MWLSVWTATVDPAGVEVSGEIKIRAHYFEDGNVQLQSKKAIESVTLPQTVGPSCRLLSPRSLIFHAGPLHGWPVLPIAIATTIAIAILADAGPDRQRCRRSH